MSRFTRFFAKMGPSQSRREVRPSLGLETLDDRIMPTALGLSPAAINPILLQGTPQINPSPVPSIVFPSASDLLNKTVKLVGTDGVTYGHVSFSVATANADGSYTLQGTFGSGTLSIPVTGTLGLYYLGGPLGFSANLSFSGIDTRVTGYHVFFSGVVTQSYQHANISGGLRVFYPPIPPLNATPVSGMWF
jgi:hypothetical protein